MNAFPRLLVLGTFSFTLLASLVHVACTASTEVDHGTSEAVSQGNGGAYGGGYGNGYDDGYGNGNGYGYDDGYSNGYGGGYNVAPDTSQ